MDDALKIVLLDLLAHQEDIGFILMRSISEDVSKEERLDLLGRIEASIQNSKLIQARIAAL